MKKAQLSPGSPSADTGSERREPNETGTSWHPTRSRFGAFFPINSLRAWKPGPPDGDQLSLSALDPECGPGTCGTSFAAMPGHHGVRGPAPAARVHQAAAGKEPAVKPRCRTVLPPGPPIFSCITTGHLIYSDGFSDINERSPHATVDIPH